MGKAPSLKIVKQPQEFFYELLTSALSKQNLKVYPETELYLVNLLNQFMITENLFVQDSEGHLKEEPLALLVKEALEEQTPHNQGLMFRKVGDISLYMGGYFQESLQRKLVDLNYYVGLGEVAYTQVAARLEEEKMRAVYQELAERFSKLVEVFAEVSDQTTPKTEKNLLLIYERWHATGNQRAAKMLYEAGLLKPKNSKKQIQ